MLAFSAFGRGDGTVGLPKQTAMRKLAMPDSTVVVCCHNESEHVAALHAAISQSVLHAREAGCLADVVMVNHGSTDDTLELLQHMAEKDPLWTVVDAKRTCSSKKEALERGMDLAKGEVLLLTDADCTMLSRRWVLDMIQGGGEFWDVHVGLSLPAPVTGRGPQRWLNRFQRLEARRIAQRTVGAIDATSPYMAFGEIWPSQEKCGTVLVDLTTTNMCHQGTTICGFKRPSHLAPRCVQTPARVHRPSPRGLKVGVHGVAKITAFLSKRLVSMVRPGATAHARSGLAVAGWRGCPQSLGDIGGVPVVGFDDALAYLRVVLAPHRPAGNRRLGTSLWNPSQVSSDFGLGGGQTSDSTPWK